MSQPNKKPAPQQAPAAKMPQNNERMANQAYDAMEAGRNSAENVVRIGSTAMKEFLSTSADEAQRAQDKIFSFGRESAENFAKSAESFSRMMSEGVAMSRDNIETCIECGNVASSLAKDMSAEMFENANRAFADCIEMSKAFFACRTLSDMYELQNRAARNQIDQFFNQSSKYTNMFFDYSSEALEPVSERMAQASEQFSKAFSNK
jgi:hypothetical protein